MESLFSCPAKTPFHRKLLECLAKCFGEVPELQADIARAAKIRKSGGCCPNLLSFGLRASQWSFAYMPRRLPVRRSVSICQRLTYRQPLSNTSAKMLTLVGPLSMVIGGEYPVVLSISAGCNAGCNGATYWGIPLSLAPPCIGAASRLAARNVTDA